MTYEDPGIKCLHPIIAIDCQDRMLDLYGLVDKKDTPGAEPTPALQAGVEEYQKGKYGKAVYLNGTSWWNITDNSTLLDYTKDTPFSMSIWIYPITGMASNRTILCKGTDVVGENAPGWALFYKDGGNQGTDDRVTFHMTDGGTTLYDTKTSTGTITMDAWNHIVVTYDGSDDRAGITVYVDTVPYTNSSVTGMGDITNANFVALGAESDGGRVGTMRAQFINFYDFELTQTQVNDIFNNENPWGTVSKTTGAEEFHEDIFMEESFFEGGTNSGHGAFAFIIDDSTKQFIDMVDPQRPSLFKRNWTLELWLGKTPGGMYCPFQGTIQAARPIFSSTGVVQQRIFAIGDKELLSRRYTNISKFQDHSATSGEGDMFESNDESTKIDNLAKTLITETDHLAVEGLPQLPFTTEQIKNIGIQLRDFQKNHVPCSQSWEELANTANCYMGIDGSRDAYMWIKGTEDSGILVTNDIDNTDYDSWDAGKYATIETAPNWFEDSIVGGGYSIIHGLGYVRYDVDDVQESANSALDSFSKWYGLNISPTGKNIAVISLFLAETPGGGTITDDAVVEIRLQDATTQKPNEVLRTMTIPAEILNALDSTGKYVDIEVSPPLEIDPDKKYSIVIQKYTDNTNKFDIDYQTGTGTYFDSSDGSTWTSQTGDIKFRIYSSKATRIILEDVEARAKFGEKETVFPLNEYSNKSSALVVLFGIAESQSQENRQFPEFTITPPDVEIKPGKDIRIIDIGSNLDMVASVTRYSISWSAYDKQSNLGARQVSLVVENFRYG